MPTREESETMILEVGTDWRIESTELSWQVSRRKSKEHHKSKASAGESWMVEAWCNTFEDALQYVFRRKVRAVPGSDPVKIMEALEAIRQEIRGVARRFDEACA